LIYCSLPVASERHPPDRLYGEEIALRAMRFAESKLVGGRSIVKCSRLRCKTSRLTEPREKLWPTLAYSGLYNRTGKPVYLNKLRSAAEKPECPPKNFDCTIVSAARKHNPEVFNASWYLDYLDDLIHSGYENTSPENTCMLARASAIEYGLDVAADPSEIRGSRYADTLSLLTAAKEAQDLGDASLKGLDNRTYNRGVCWLHLAWIEFYRPMRDNPNTTYDAALRRYDAVNESEASEKMQNKTPGQTFLEPTIEFFDNMDFSRQSKDNPNLFLVPLAELQPCAEALLLLYDTTGEERFLDDGLSILQHFIDSRWDSQESPKFSGDDGFFSLGCRLRSPYKLSCYGTPKKLAENSYSIYLFSLAANHVFNVPRGVYVKRYQYPSKDPLFNKDLSSYAQTTTYSIWPAFISGSNDSSRVFAFFQYIIFVIVAASIYFFLKAGGETKG